MTLCSFPRITHAEFEHSHVIAVIWVIEIDG